MRVFCPSLELGKWSFHSDLHFLYMASSREWCRISTLHFELSVATVTWFCPCGVNNSTTRQILGTDHQHTSSSINLRHENCWDKFIWKKISPYSRSASPSLVSIIPPPPIDSWFSSGFPVLIHSVKTAAKDHSQLQRTTRPILSWFPAFQ